MIRFNYCLILFLCFILINIVSCTQVDEKSLSVGNHNANSIDGVKTESIVHTITPCQNDLLTEMDEYHKFSGTISYVANWYDVFLLEGNSSASKNIIDMSGSNSHLFAGFSPNGEWLAFSNSTISNYDNVSTTLHLLSRDGVDLKVNVRNENLDGEEYDDYFGIWGEILWINNNEMLVYILKPLENSPGYPYYVKGLLNVFEGTWDYRILDIEDRNPNAAISVSPDSQRFLYVGNETTNYPIIKLRDSNKDQVLWEYKENSWSNSFILSEEAWFGAVAWSPDSNWVAFSLNEVEPNTSRKQGVYLLNRDGEHGKFITNFHGTGFLDFAASGLSWSPDGNLLAMALKDFSGSASNYYKNRLYIYDLENDTLIDHCDLNIGSSWFNSTSKGLVWSPDSQHIAYISDVETSLDGVQSSPTVHIIDIYKGLKIQVLQEDIIDEIGGWSDYFSP